MEKSYNVKEASQILGLSSQTVLARLHRQELFGYKEGHEWRVTEKAIEDYRREKMPKHQKEFLFQLGPETYHNLDKLLEQEDFIMMKSVKVAENRWRTCFGGFYFREREDGIRDWYIWYPDSSKKSKRTNVAVPGILNEKMANDHLSRLLIKEAVKYEIKDLKELGLLKKEEKKITVRELLEDRQKWCNEGGRSHYKAPQWQIKWENETIACIKDMAAEEVDAKMLEKIAKPAWKKIGEERKGGGWKGGVINPRLEIISTIYNWAIRRKSLYGIRDNPVESWLFLPVTINLTCTPC